MVVVVGGSQCHLDYNGHIVKIFAPETKCHLDYQGQHLTGKDGGSPKRWGIQKDRLFPLA